MPGQPIIDAAMVFQYINKPEVCKAFKAVQKGIQGILADVDGDTLHSFLKPRNIQPFMVDRSTWPDTYSEFMKRFLVNMDGKMGLWLHNCKQALSDKMDQSFM